MTPRALLRAVMADRLGVQPADWEQLAATYGETLAPFAGLAPPDAPDVAIWRQQVAVEALGHLGTLQELCTWDLPFLTLKGIAWGALFWQDVTARPAHDLDIVIRDGDWQPWQTRLTAAGFVVGPSPLVWRRGRQIVQLHGPATGSHWLHAVQPDWPTVWEHAVWQEVAGLRLQLPDLPDTLLYLAHHQVFRHGLDHDQGWIDLAGWLDRAPAGALDIARQRSQGTHQAPSLAVLAWAWRDVWAMPGLETVPVPNGMQRGLAAWALRRPGDWRSQSALSLALAAPHERSRLVQDLPGAFRRWRRWGSQR